MGPAPFADDALTTQDTPGFLDALAAVQRGLDALGAPSMIIGGVAVIALGVPRLTVDIDATVEAASIEVERLSQALAGQAIVPRMPEARAFARERQVYLAVHEASGIPVDVSLAWLPFEADALRASRSIDFAGVRIRIPRPEDLLIYKLIASRARDLDDAEGLLLLHGATMDLPRIRTTVKQFADVLEDAERTKALETLIAKAGL